MVLYRLYRCFICGTTYVWCELFRLTGGSVRVLSGEGYSVQEEFGFYSRVAKSE